ncbi:hypothetical protein AMAG_19103 [Allomyces macrogynus ATCC 38327]|uniref:Uncharacterized protein n=1 Tax=Allomyces macrogynus (strain ATCC 38327) TaxID=578462 RepID=A0A0L0SNY0_ALLM3|nr:hypothetical protein AMAG_19103 [Allomyces macrogynus ATCC 38327]|eukprot:KNE64070.1 hypothetical protein AMAG_19103 [Allomyces macrogynus ATCC 38327]
MDPPTTAATATTNSPSVAPTTATNAVPSAVPATPTAAPASAVDLVGTDLQAAHAAASLAAMIHHHAAATTAAAAQAAAAQAAAAQAAALAHPNGTPAPAAAGAPVAGTPAPGTPDVAHHHGLATPAHVAHALHNFARAVYRVVDSAAVIRDLEALTGHAALEGRPVPLPIKQRVCATIKSLAHSRRDRQELWMAVCAKTAPMQVTSKEVKETWDRLVAQGRVGAHAMHRPALTGHAALEGRPVPLPIKQRVCATIKSLAHSRRDRQELWMAVCAKTAPMQVTSKEVKETWDRLVAQGRVGAHAMHRPGAGHDDDDEISHQHPVGMVAGMLSTTLAANEEAAAAAAAAAALAATGRNTDTRK